MGLRDLKYAIWSKKTDKKIRKAEYSSDKVYKESAARNAEMIHQEMLEEGIEQIKSDVLDTAAQGFFDNGDYLRAAIYYDELIKRNYVNDNGYWAENASYLYYFGYGGTEKNKGKAGDARMCFWEQNKETRVSPIDVLGVFFDRYFKTKNPEDHRELAVLTKDRMDGIMEKSLLATKEAVEHPLDIPWEDKNASDFNPKLMAAEQYVAYKDLERLGYWQTARTAEAVTGLFGSLADKGDAAAMYWLAVCHFAGITGGKMEDAEKLLGDSAKMGYTASISEYYRSFRNNLQGEELAAMKAEMERIQNKGKEILLGFTSMANDGAAFEGLSAEKCSSCCQNEEADNAMQSEDDGDNPASIEDADCAQILTEVAQTLLSCYKPDDEAGYGGATVRSWLQNLYGTNSFGLADSIKTNHNNWADKLTDKQSIVEKLCKAGMAIAYRKAMNGDIFAVVDLFSAGYVFENMDLTAAFAAKIAKAGNTYALEEMARMCENGYEVFGRAIAILRANGVQGAEAAARYITSTNDTVKENLLREIKDLSKKDSMHFEYDTAEEGRYAKKITAMLKKADKNK